MKYSRLFLLTRLPLLLSVNCATFGVEAEDHVLTIDSQAQGVTRFEVADMPTHEGMFILGGSDIFAGEMRVTGWFAPGDDHDIFDYIGLAFEHDDDTLSPHTLFHSVEAEHITVRQVIFDVPRDLDVHVLRPDGGLLIDDIAGAVSVRQASGYVGATNIAGEVDIDGAGTVELDNTGPVDVDIVGSVRGKIAAGGRVSVGFGDIDAQVTGRDFERLTLTSDKGEVELDLPRGQGYTLDIQAGYSVGDGDRERKGHVTIDVGDVFVDRDGVVSEVFQVNGGGPLIVVRDAHELEIH